MIAKWKQFSDLFLASKHKHTFGEHDHVVGHWIGASEQEMPVEVRRLLVRVARYQVPELGVRHDHSESVPPLLKLFSPRLLVIVE